MVIINEMKNSKSRREAEYVYQQCADRGVAAAMIGSQVPKYCWSIKRFVLFEQGVPECDRHKSSQMMNTSRAQPHLLLAAGDLDYTEPGR